MEDIVNKSCDILKKGRVILYPSDTIWAIGCDATNEAAVTKIYTLKRRDESKALICLVSSLEMLQHFVGNISDKIKLLALRSKPTTIIYSKVTGLASNLLAENGSVGIRIVQDTFCKNLIQLLKKPIISTSANISGTQNPKEFKEINSSIFQGVDYIVPLKKKERNSHPSTIILVNKDGSYKTIRP